MAVLKLFPGHIALFLRFCRSFNFPRVRPTQLYAIARDIGTCVRSHPALDAGYLHYSCPFPVTEVPALELGTFHSFSDKFLNSLFCFLRENPTSSVASPPILSLSPDSPGRWRTSSPEAAPARPELRCPVLPSEAEEAGRRAHSLELPTGHPFPSKGTKDRGREAASWRLFRGGSALPHLPLPGPPLPITLTALDEIRTKLFPFLGHWLEPKGQIRLVIPAVICSLPGGKQLLPLSCL